MGRPATASTRPPASAALALHHLPGKLITKDDVEGEKWYDCTPAWPVPASGGLCVPPAQWQQVAEAALSSATRAYEKKFGGGGGAAARALGKEQTVGDRIASVTLRVQESPVHRVQDLRELLSFARKKGRRESMPAMEALKDLFVNDLLPPERRLVLFEDREFECGKHEPLSKRHVAYAWFEGVLKVVYREFLGILEECGKDSLAHFKQKAVKMVAELLVARPECEKELLAMLVNKLGDPDRKVSSTASYSLLQLIEKHHPQMRLIVVREVEQLLLRPNVTPKAQYFSVSFLNQIRFARDDTEIARWLLRIYMQLFTSCLAREKHAENPKDAKKQPGKVKKARWKKKSQSQKNKPAVKQEAPSEAKESRLMGALLIGANRAYPYTKPEQDETSYQKHFDALFEVAHAKTLGPATQALSFLFQVSQSNATQSDRFYRALYSRICDAAEAGDSKQALFLNLVYKAMNADTDPRRIKAYSKRLLQAALSGTPAFAGACVVVLSECFKGKRFGGLKSLISIAEGDDDVEHFVDVDKDSGENAGAKASFESAEKDEAKESGLGTEDSTCGGKKGEEKAAPPSENTSGAMRYDPLKRDPQYAGAERSCLWELVSLCNHFHPSISTFARALCVKLKSVEYGGDPLKDFAEMAFLDKFVYKKAKNRVAKSLYGKRSASYRDDPVANTAAFQELAKTGGVGEDDKFFVRFFDANPNRIVQGDLDDGEGDDEGGSEEEAFEQAMQTELRRLGADQGFSSEGIKRDVGDVGDVDSEDEDELQAFEKAFKDDMVQDAGAGSNEEESDEDSEKEVARKKKKGKRGKTIEKRADDLDSVFASAEDYREAIDADAVREERKRARVEHEESDGGVDEEDKGKRRTKSDKPEKPTKKRRRKKVS